MAGGKVLALGNSPEAPAGGLEYPRTYYHWCRDAERGRMSVPAHILKWAMERPMAFLELKFRALMLFWDAREIPNNVNIDIHGKDSSLLQLPVLLPWAVLGTLGLAGFLLRIHRRNACQLALTWMMLAFWGATSAFYILARFRIGFLPLLCCAGGGGILLIIRRLRDFKANGVPLARQSGLAVTCLALLFSCYMVNFACPLYQSYVEPAIQRRLNPNGLNLVFPREFVLYDHGPISTVASLIEVPSQGAVLTKRFFLPDDFRALLSDEAVDRMVRQRLLLLVHGTGRGVPAAVLTFNGTRLPIQPTIQFQYGAKWLVFDFDAPLPSKGTQAIFQIDLGPSASFPKLSFGMDYLRDYGRTSLRVPGIEQETMPAEAVVEWVIPRRRSLPQSGG
ncbi:MAG: hypothetical protein J6Y80_01450 [Victivallales bacterium]|nr:hypothetical protein [Victivallales bacterium]